MTIRRLRLIAFLGSLLLVAASVAVTFAALQTQRDDALVINLAGRQRMLIQRMTLEVLGTQIGANRVYREDLHDTAHAYFEVTLSALISGGQAPYADGVTVTLPPTRSPQILAQLETVRANWEEMHTAIHAVLDSDPQGPAFAEGVAAVERLSPVMLAQMDETVRLYEAEAARKVARVQSIQIGFLAAAASLLAAALVLTERWVLNPIDQLGSAARRIGKGDLDTPVSVAGPGEIDQLTRSFDDMRRNLAASREERERWAAELDGRVAARTREVISLSTIAQAANRHTEIDSLLDEVLPLLAEITAASSAWVSLLDEYGNFSLAGAHNLPPALEADDRAEMRWPGCLCQRRLLAGELTAAANILECQRLQQARGDTRGLHYHASVPLRAAARALGLLNLTTAAGYVFGDDELRLLTAVGDQLGVAIERARLHAQMKARYVAEQTVLLRLSQALLSESDPQAIMDTAVRVAAEALRVEFAAILLVDADEQSYSLRSSMGWPSEVPQQAQH
ncbi:MAG: HAMP domain-containing protein, partial [Lysobacteraceae bacterium]